MARSNEETLLVEILRLVKAISAQVKANNAESVALIRAIMTRLKINRIQSLEELLKKE